MPWLSTELNSAERERAWRLIHEKGVWLRRHEPPASVYEDLLGHELRTLLVSMMEAVDRLERRAVQHLIRQVERVTYKLVIARLQRGVR